MVLIDFIIIAIILFFAFFGYKRGLVKVAIKLCTFFIAIIVAFILFKPAATLVMDKTTIDDTIESAITTKILPDNAEATDVVDVNIQLPSVLLEKGANTVKDIASSFATVLIQICCFLLIFILAKIILKFITILADAIAKLPILNQFNKLGGTIYGILEGIFFVFTLLAIISIVVPLTDNTTIIESINSSTLGAWFYNNNLLLHILH